MQFKIAISNAIYYLQVFELLMRDGVFWPMRMLRTYRSLRTLLFMAISGVVIDSMYLNSDSVFWLFKPLKRYPKSQLIDINENMIKPTEQFHICHHKNSCNAHIAQVRSCFLFIFLTNHVSSEILTKFELLPFLGV